MDALARYALFGCVLASSLGGIAVCVVGFKYGLAPPAEDDPIEATHRRLFVTHLAHAFAVVAFALTAMLAGSVLMLDRRAPSSAAGQRNEVEPLGQFGVAVPDPQRRASGNRLDRGGHVTVAVRAREGDDGGARAVHAATRSTR